MTPSRKRQLVAVVIGIALSAVPVAAFNLWLDRFIEQRGREETTAIARRSLALADLRITRAIDALAELAGRGVDSCKGAHIEALRQANFSTAPIKELSVINPAGETLCTDLAIPLGLRKVVSSHLLTMDGDLLMQVVQLGDRRRPMIRIQRAGPTNAIAALLPAEIFLPPSALAPDRTKGHMQTITTRDGSPIARGRRSSRPGAQGERDRFVTTVQSDRYNLAATAVLPRERVAARYEHLNVIGTVIAGIFGLAIIALGLILPARRRADPAWEIERALEAGEFVPYFQPIVDIASGKLLGAEVLMRWRKPPLPTLPRERGREGEGVVLPGAFIPLMESSGLIREATRALMRQVLAEIGVAYASRPNLHIGFNLAAAHFVDETIVQEVREIFQESPIRLNQVVLEVTERQPLENLTKTRRIIAALQGLGVAVAIDDVGTGHSGLSYLLKLGVDIIKIDKMFVDAIGNDRHSTTIIETLIDLARNMRMDIVAEGVENFEQVVLLRDLGIRAAQGYVFAPPLPASSFAQLIEAIDPLSAAQVPNVGAPTPAAGPLSAA